jgi:hypothetical protein
MPPPAHFRRILGADVIVVKLVDIDALPGEETHVGKKRDDGGTPGQGPIPIGEGGSG